jgi:glutaminyl-peptide cyclotransferase
MKPLLFMLIVVFLTGCPDQNKASSKAPKIKLAELPEIDGREALKLVQKQLDFGPRTLNSKAAKNCAWFIADFAENLGYKVKIDTWTEGTGKNSKVFRNVICTKSGAGEQYVICGSHYDTKTIQEFPNFTGANDGGSSTALLMQVMKQMAGSPIWKTNCEIRFVFFDGEEALVEYTNTDGLNGSRRYAGQIYSRNEHFNCRAMLLLDMVGDKDLKLTIPTNSDKKLLDKTMSIANQLKLDQHVSVLQADHFHDDHVPFIALGIPSIDFIDFDYGPDDPNSSGGAYWHTGKDTIDKLSAESLTKVGNLFTHVLYNLSKNKISGSK